MASTTNPPIHMTLSRVTLYKNSVAFFEKTATISSADGATTCICTVPRGEKSLAIDTLSVRPPDDCNVAPVVLEYLYLADSNT